MPSLLRSKPNWGSYPNKMAAALYLNRKRHRNDPGYGQLPSPTEPGPELIVDGGFVEACGVHWVCGVGWTIIPPAHSDGSTGILHQNFTTIPGNTYLVKFTTSGAYAGVSGLLVSLSGAGWFGIMEDGPHEMELVAGSGAGGLYFEVASSGDFIGDLSGVSVTEIIVVNTFDDNILTFDNTKNTFDEDD